MNRYLRTNALSDGHLGNSVHRTVLLPGVRPVSGSDRYSSPAINASSCSSLNRRGSFSPAPLRASPRLPLGAQTPNILLISAAALLSGHLGGLKRTSDDVLAAYLHATCLHAHPVWATSSAQRHPCTVQIDKVLVNEPGQAWMFEHNAISSPIACPLAADLRYDNVNSAPPREPCPRQPWHPTTHQAYRRAPPFPAVKREPLRHISDNEDSSSPYSLAPAYGVMIVTLTAHILGAQGP